MIPDKVLKVTTKRQMLAAKIQAYADKFKGGNWTQAIFELAEKGLKR